MPGVHMRLASLELHMLAHDTQFFGLKNHITSERKRCVDTIGEGLQAFADTVKRGRTVEPRTTIQQHTMNESAGDELNELYLVSQHRMVPNPSSVEDLYNEFFGLHSFSDKPMVGGVAAAESKFGSKWRRGWKGSSKYISRVKTIIRGLEVLSGENDGSMVKAIETLDQVFASDPIRKRVSNLVTYLQDKGIIAKGKSRSPSANR